MDLGFPMAGDDFTISVDANNIRLTGNIRDAIVQLVDVVGMRQAPFLKRGATKYQGKAE